MAKKKEVVKFGDGINFVELFRVKGKQGLFTLRSKVNKAGMVGVMEFMRYDNKVTAKASEMECLGHLVFETFAGHENLMMNDVFNNLFDFFEANTGVTPTLEDAVPNHDPEKFKQHHLDKVLMWYNEIVDKLNEISDETEA